jgi:hypothetical protein
MEIIAESKIIMLTANDIQKIKEIVANPIEKKIDDLKQDLHDYKTENNECHKSIKKELENLKIFKGKMIGIFSVITFIFSFIGSYLWNKIIKGQ